MEVLFPHRDTNAQSNEDDDIAGAAYTQNRFTFNPGINIKLESDTLDELLVSPVTKKAKKIDVQKEKILEIKREQDLHKKMKLEFGEKRIGIEEVNNKKGDDDDDMIEDPDSGSSPETNLKKRQRMREKFIRKQASRSRTSSPFI